MKITFLTSRYPSVNDPYNHMFVHSRAVEFIKQKEVVEVYVPSNNKSSYIHEGVTVYKMPAKDIAKLLGDKEIVYLHLLNLYPFSKRNAWHIYRTILQENISFAMYVHGSEVQKFGAYQFDFTYSITSFLKWFKKDILVIPKIKRFVADTQNRENSRYIFPSLWMMKELEGNLDLALEKFDIIPNGIDIDKFKFNDCFNNRFKLVTLRPLSSKKYAVDVAIETMKYLPETYTLDIYGKGHLQSEYQKQIDRANLSNRVSIKNMFIDSSKMGEFFSQFGVLLSPTRMDAQGVTMCEAMASGLLVASSSNTAIPEFIIDNGNGIMDNDPKILAQKIRDTTQNENLYRSIVEKGRSSMETIAINKSVAKELEILAALKPH